MAWTKKIFPTGAVIDKASQVRTDSVQCLRLPIDETQVHRADTDIRETVPSIDLVCYNRKLSRRAICGDRVKRGNPDEATLSFNLVALSQRIEIKPQAGPEWNQADQRAKEHAEKLDEAAPFLNLLFILILLNIVVRPTGLFLLGVCRSGGLTEYRVVKAGVMLLPLG